MCVRVSERPPLLNLHSSGCQVTGSSPLPQRDETEPALPGDVYRAHPIFCLYFNLIPPDRPLAGIKWQRRPENNSWRQVWGYSNTRWSKPHQLMSLNQQEVFFQGVGRKPQTEFKRTTIKKCGQTEKICEERGKKRRNTLSARAEAATNWNKIFLNHFSHYWIYLAVMWFHPGRFSFAALWH